MQELGETPPPLMVGVSFSSNPSIPASSSYLNTSNSSSLIQEEEAQLFRLSWKIFIPINIGAIIALSPVCLMEKLPKEWLKLPLIAVLCLLALALVLSTFPLLLAPYLKIRISKVHQKYIKEIFIVLTMLAVLIIVGTCVAYLTMNHFPKVASRELCICALE